MTGGAPAAAEPAPGRARARELGLAPGVLPTGPYNAITDVAGVRVGHATVVQGSDIRTGVTAIVPGGLVSAAGPGVLTAGLSVFNGYGKIVGSTQVAELGVIETPVLLTATLSVFRVADALLSYLHELPGRADLASVNPVVAETNDAFLSDIWARPVTERHVHAAIDDAASGPVAGGCVGAGAGTAALGFKAGIGSASRVFDTESGPVTLGVLVQANFGGVLTVLGVPVPATAALAATGVVEAAAEPAPGPGSCVIVLATDAPLDSRRLTRLASRAFAGMARAGSAFSGGSGDYALALSTAGGTGPDTAGSRPAGSGPAASGRATAGRAEPVSSKDLDLLFTAAIEATEEAILDSLFLAVTTTGYRGHVRHAVPLDYVQALVSGRSAAGLWP